MSRFKMTRADDKTLRYDESYLSEDVFFDAAAIRRYKDWVIVDTWDESMLIVGVPHDRNRPCVSLVWNGLPQGMENIRRGAIVSIDHFAKVAESQALKLEHSDINKGHYVASFNNYSHGHHEHQENHENHENYENHENHEHQF